MARSCNSPQHWTTTKTCWLRETKTRCRVRTGLKERTWEEIGHRYMLIIVSPHISIIVTLSILWYYCPHCCFCSQMYVYIVNLYVYFVLMNKMVINLFCFSRLGFEFLVIFSLMINSFWVFLFNFHSPFVHFALLTFSSNVCWIPLKLNFPLKLK